MIIKYSSYFLKTLRENPKDAESNGYAYLQRAGFVKPLKSGLFIFLPLGIRVLEKLIKVIDFYMADIGANKVSFPSLLPAEQYKASNRWEEYGPALYRLKDRKNSDFLLSPTHEEFFACLAKDIISSYKDLPISLYQITNKYRDELRARSGLLRGKEFLMKDAYSFHIDQNSLDKTYKDYEKAYIKIFNALGIDFIKVKANAGAMGGSVSDEFLAPTPLGEDEIVISEKGYAANKEAAELLAPKAAEAICEKAEKIYTPNILTIDKLYNFLQSNGQNIQKTDILKAVVYKNIKTKKLIVFFMPSDRYIDPKRLEAYFGEDELKEAGAEDILQYGLIAGFIGPNIAADYNIEIYFDIRVQKGSAWLTGANEKDYHMQNMQAGRDFEIARHIDICNIKDGDICVDGSSVKLQKALEIAHIFQLGDKYSKAFDLTVKDADNKNATVLMGSYGIGVTRLLALIAEKNFDKDGLIWPKIISPFDYYIIILTKNKDILDAAEIFCKDLEASGADIFIDDRNISAGVKFKDAYLIGCSKIIVISEAFADGKIEIIDRLTNKKQNKSIKSLIK